MSSDFHVRFWGTRGSIATPGADKSRFGGNTTCVEMMVGEHRLIFDAGTGIRELGDQMVAESPEGGHASLLFSHTHWDHIQGFPFFGPAYHPGFSLHIYGNAASRAHIKDLLHGQMQQAYFPIPFSALQGRIEFHDLNPAGHPIGGAIVRSMAGVHPGGVNIYRVDYNGHSAAFCTDVELDQMVVSEPGQPKAYGPEILDFLAGIDVLIVDCQYTDELYAERKLWGHPSLSAVVALVAGCGVGRTFLTHHDPNHDDDMISSMVHTAGLQLSMMNSSGLIHGAREQMVIAVDI